MIVVKKHFYLNIVLVTLVTVAYVAQTCTNYRFQESELVRSFYEFINNSARVVHFYTVLDKKYQFKLFEISQSYALNIYKNPFTEFIIKEFFRFPLPKST